MFFGRIDLRIGVSRATFDAKSDFEVHLAIAPPQSIKNEEKLFSETETNSNLFFVFLIFFSTTDKCRLRLKFCQYVLLDLPERPASPKKFIKLIVFDKFSRKLSRSPPPRDARSVMNCVDHADD